MQILMTGATGFVGSVVAQTLAKAGHQLKLLVRHGSRTEHLAHLDLELIEGDILDPGSLAVAMRDVDAVVHTAGNTDSDPRNRKKVWRVNVEGTANVLNAAVTVGVQRVVYTSSVAAIGSSSSPTELLDEDCPWRAGKHVSTYVRSKYTAEREAFNIAQRGVELIALNPSVIIGPGDHTKSSTGLLLGFVKGKMPGYLDGGIGLVDVRDVALAHLRALEGGDPGERYIISAENRTLGELLDELCPMAGVEKPRKIPGPVALGLATINELVIGRFKPTSAARFNRGIADDGQRYWFVDNSRSRQQLNMSYRPLRESLIDMLRWALHNGQLRATTPELELLEHDDPIHIPSEVQRMLSLDAPASGANPR